MTRLAASHSAFEAVNTLSVTCLMARLAASHSAFEVMNTTFDITFIYGFWNLRGQKSGQKSGQNSLPFGIFSSRVGGTI